MPKMSKKYDRATPAPPEEMRGRARGGEARPWRVEYRLKPEVAAEMASRPSTSQYMPGPVEWTELLWARYATPGQRVQAFRVLTHRSANGTMSERWREYRLKDPE